MTTTRLPAGSLSVRAIQVDVAMYSDRGGALVDEHPNCPVQRATGASSADDMAPAVRDRLRTLRRRKAYLTRTQE